MNQYKILNKFFLFVGLLSATFSGINAQTEKKGKMEDKIEWLSFEEAVKRNEKVKKKLLIDVYTSWCGWCKHMDRTTYEDKAIIDYISKNYYAVKLDAEHKDTVKFREHTFVYRPEYKTHELALSLLNNKMGYPTTIFMDENFAIIAPVPGFIDAKGMTPMLKFVAENSYQSKSWEDFQKELNKEVTR